MKRLWKFELTLDDGQTLYVGADGNPDSASMFEGEEGDAAREAVRRVCEFEAVHGVTPASVRYESHGKANTPRMRREKHAPEVTHAMVETVGSTGFSSLSIRLFAGFVGSAAYVG